MTLVGYEKPNYYQRLFDFVFGKPIRPWRLKDNVHGMPLDVAISKFLHSDIGGQLSDLQRFVFVRLYGLNGDPPITVGQIIETTKISKETILRAEQLAKKKLRTPSRVVMLEKYIVKEE